MGEREVQFIAQVSLWRDHHPECVISYPAIVLIDDEAPGFSIDEWLEQQRAAVKATLAPFLGTHTYLDIQMPLPTRLNRPSHAASPSPPSPPIGEDPQ